MRKDAAPHKFVAFAKNLPKGKISLVMSVCPTEIEERDYHG